METKETTLGNNYLKASYDFYVAHLEYMQQFSLNPETAVDKDGNKIDIVMLKLTVMEKERLMNIAFIEYCVEKGNSNPEKSCFICNQNINPIDTCVTMENDVTNSEVNFAHIECVKNKDT